MRKQTKLVAVLSAAALLAMGASMTSFAAGWQKDDAGVWHYYDSDDEMVTGEWKKDGGKCSTSMMREIWRPTHG